MSAPSVAEIHAWLTERGYDAAHHRPNQPRVAFVAYRHGAEVGVGSTPEQACRIAQQHGITKCEVLLVEQQLAVGAAERLSRKTWASERELLEQLLASHVEGIDTHGSPIDDMSDETLYRRLDAIEAELVELVAPPLAQLSLEARRAEP